MATNAYGELLPPQCPPATAGENALVEVYRLVPTEQPDTAAFASFAANGDKKPDTYEVSDCDWASCSLRTTAAALLKLTGLRKRNPFIVTLTIPEGSGKHTTSGTHINFWRYSHFNLVSAVTNVRAHGL